MFMLLLLHFFWNLLIGVNVSNTNIFEGAPPLDMDINLYVIIIKLLNYILNVLWYVDPLPDNDREIISYTIAVTK
jgi:hypothetical protein